MFPKLHVTSNSVHAECERQLHVRISDLKSPVFTVWRSEYTEKNSIVVLRVKEHSGFTNQIIIQRPSSLCLAARCQRNRHSENYLTATLSKKLKS